MTLYVRNCGALQRVCRAAGSAARAAPRPRPHLQEVGHLGVAVDHQAVDVHLELALLRILQRHIVLGQPRAPLPVLQQDEAYHHSSRGGCWTQAAASDGGGKEDSSR